MKFNYFYTNIGVAIIWIILYVLNFTLFKLAYLNVLTSLIFIPSGFKIACILIFRERAILGLFLGALITGFLFLKNIMPIHILSLAAFSAIVPFFTLKIFEIIDTPFEASLSNLSDRHIIPLSLIYATLNGLLHIGYRFHYLTLDQPKELKELAVMMLGDILGIFLFMWLIAKLSRLSWIQSFLKK